MRFTFNALVSLDKSSLILSPGLKAGRPLYGQVEHLKASPNIAIEL